MQAMPHVYDMLFRYRPTDCPSMYKLNIGKPAAPGLARRSMDPCLHTVGQGDADLFIARPLPSSLRVRAFVSPGKYQ